MICDHVNSSLRSGHRAAHFMTVEELSSHVAAAGFGLVDQGVLPNAVLQLVSPRLAARLKGLPFRLVNLFVTTFLSWVPRYCVMRYCVARKPFPADRGVL